jgi:diaminopimelate epimerase
MPIKFIKFHGFGNDYIVIEASELTALTGPGQLNEFARRICDRHYGAGSDGIAVVKRWESPEADFQVRIFNPDGSEASLSGNGTRCAAAYLYYQKLWDASELRLTTRAGIKLYQLRDRQPGKYVFDSELGIPKFDSASIPMQTSTPLDHVIDYEIDVDDAPYQVTALQIGNPITCIFVNRFDEFDWRRVGKILENHPQFPDRTNVVFVRVLDRKSIELRIWERGVGETMASGTCSCAGAVASMIKGETERDIEVLMPGGRAHIRWRDDGGGQGEVVLTGGAEVIYAGEWLTTTP